MSNWLGFGTEFFCKSLIKLILEMIKFRKFNSYYAPDALSTYIDDYHTQLFITHLGYIPNFKSPRTFNEFINAQKLIPFHANTVKWVDKIAVKDLILQMDSIVKVPQLLSMGATLDEVLDKNLSTPFVIKANHDSGSVWVIKDKATLTRSLKKQINQSVQSVFGRDALELQYQSIPRLLFAEEFLGNNILDYKLFVYNGSVKFIQVDVDRFTNHTRSFYDTEWNKLSFGLIYSQYDGHISKPKGLSELISFCESLNTGRSFFRGDFYLKENEWYFGEITFFPESGFGEFNPVKYDALVWQMFNGNHVKELGV